MNILVSACLMGEPCRFDGASKRNDALVRALDGHSVVLVCPEVDGGLPCPRLPSEIDVETGRVVNTEGADVTGYFERGAELCVATARAHACRLAVLKAKSPSCGCGFVYDGSFTGTLVEGDGIAARALKAAGFSVIDEDSFLADHAGVLAGVADS